MLRTIVTIVYLCISAIAFAQTEPVRPKRILRTDEVNLGSTKLTGVARSAAEVQEGNANIAVSATALKEMLAGTGSYSLDEAQAYADSLFQTIDGLSTEAAAAYTDSLFATIQRGDTLSQAQLDSIATDLRAVAENTATTLVEGVSRRIDSLKANTMPLPALTFAHQRRVVDVPYRLKAMQYYRFEITAPHDRDTFIYAAPRSNSMVLTEIVSDTLNHLVRVEGTFYVTEAEDLEIFFHAVDLKRTKIQSGGFVRLTELAEVDPATRKKRYYYDYATDEPLYTGEVVGAMDLQNWRSGDAFDLGNGQLRVNVYLNKRDTTQYYANLPTPAITDGWKVIAFTLTHANKVGGDMEKIQVVASEKENLEDPFGRYMYPIRENNSATYYLYIPDSVTEIRSIGLRQTGPMPGSESSANARNQFNLQAVQFKNRRLEIGEGPAASVVNDLMAEAEYGDTIDMGFLPIYLGERVDFNGVHGLTLRNMFLYDTITRGPNEGNSQHWISLSNGSDNVVENTTIFAARNERKYTLPALDTVKLDRWVYRHYEPGYGPTHRIDMWGHSAGDTLELYWDRNDKFAPGQDHTRPFARYIAPTADTVRWRFDLKNFSWRYRMRLVPGPNGSATDTVTTNPWDVVDHIYAYEFSSGFKAGDGANNNLIKNAHVEGVLGDALQLSPGLDGIIFRDFTSIGSGRQGISVNGGYNIELYDFEIDRAGRSLFDVEPYAFHWLVYGMKVRNFHLRNAMALGYISGHDKRVFHADVDGFYCHENVDQCWRGGTMYGRIRNVVGRDLSMGGYKTIISNVRTTSFRLNGGDTKVTPFGDTVRMGYNVLRDAVIEKESFEDGNGLIVTDSTNSVFNVRISAQNMKPDYTSRFGLTKIEPNVTIGHLIREDLETFFPNMLPENYSAPIGEVSAYLEENANVTWTGELDGTFKYKLGVLVPGHETREVIVPDSLVITYDSSSTVGSRIVIRNWRDLGNGRFYQEFNLYRYPDASATEPDHVYRIRKLGRDAASSDFDLRDEGDRIVAVSSGNYYGYPQKEIDGTKLVYFDVDAWDGPAGEYIPKLNLLRDEVYKVTLENNLAAQRLEVVEADLRSLDSGGSISPVDTFRCGCRGQSNMDGRDNTGDLAPDDRILIARLDSTTERWEPSDNNPCFQFAKAYLRKNPNCIFVAFFRAQGGTSLEAWYAGSVLRSEWEAIVAAHGNPHLDAILHHQGERDRLGSGINGGASDNEEANDKYYTKFYEEVYAYDVAQPYFDATTPFVVGEVYEGPGRDYTTNVNDALRRIGSDDNPWTTTAKTGLLRVFDGLHFRGTSVDTMGQRYYTAFLQAPYQISTTTTTTERIDSTYITEAKAAQMISDSLALLGSPGNENEFCLGYNFSTAGPPVIENHGGTLVYDTAMNAYQLVDGDNPSGNRFLNDDIQSVYLTDLRDTFRVEYDQYIASPIGATRSGFFAKSRLGSTAEGLVYLIRNGFGRLYISTGGGSLGEVPNQGGTVYQPDTWQKVVVTYENGTLRVTVDGVEDVNYTLPPEAPYRSFSAFGFTGNYADNNDAYFVNNVKTYTPGCRNGVQELRPHHVSTFQEWVINTQVSPVAGGEYTMRLAGAPGANVFLSSDSLEKGAAFHLYVYGLASGEQFTIFASDTSLEKLVRAGSAPVEQLGFIEPNQIHHIRWDGANFRVD